MGSLTKEGAMSKELTHITNSNDETRHILYLLGGAAIVVFGAGLILSTPAVRRFLGDGLGNIMGAGIPNDIARYMRMRAM